MQNLIRYMLELVGTTAAGVGPITPPGAGARQGAWDANEQGAWQQDATHHVGNLSDSMTGSDALAAEAGIPLGDIVHVGPWLDCDSQYYAGDTAGMPLHPIYTNHVCASALIRAPVGMAADGLIISATYAGPGFAFSVATGTGLLAVGMVDSLGNWFIMAGTTDLRDGQWHHVAARIDKGGNANCKVFVDGQDDTSARWSDITTVGDVTAQGRLAIGCQGRHPDWTGVFAGQIRDVKFLEHATVLWSDADIAYQAAWAFDYGPNAGTLTDYWDCLGGSGLILTGNVGNLTINNAAIWGAADSKVLDAAGELSDAMSGGDLLALEAGPSLSDAMSGAEVLALLASILLEDQTATGLSNVGHIDDGGSAASVWGDGTYIYVANSGDGLRAYTFDGANFTNVGHIDDGGSADGVWGDGTYLYLGNGADGLRAYTFDGANFTNVGHIDDGGNAGSVWGDGTYIYLANATDGLRAYTFDGANFTNVGHINDGGLGFGVWGDGSYIYLANFSDGLRAYTFDGANFTNVGHIDDGGFGFGVWGDATYIYLANNEDGLRAYTFDGANFTNVGHVDDGGYGFGVWGDGTYIYLANSSDGLRAYSFDGANFTNVGHVDGGGLAYGVWGEAGYIYLANYADGLRAEEWLVVDSLIVEVGALLADAMAGADLLTALAEVVLADAMTGLDTLVGQMAGVVFLSDVMLGSDLVVLEGSVALSDAMSAADQLVSDAEAALSDGASPTDQLTVEAGPVLADAMTGSDDIVREQAEVVFSPPPPPGMGDEMTASDSLSGVLGPGMFPGIGCETSRTLTTFKQPRQGRKAVGTTAVQPTAVAISSLNTTYDQGSVVDSNAWDLSDVETHYVVVTQTGYVGEVENTGVNTVNVRSWIKDGVNRLRMAPDTPEDGERATVFEIIRCRRILLFSEAANDKDVAFGFERNVDYDIGHLISHDVNAETCMITIEAGLSEYLNLTRFWLCAGSEQFVRWQTETH